MLTYSYKIKTSSNKEEIEVNDFYISSDLSHASGTTSPQHSFDVGDKLTVKTDYYPRPMFVKVTSCDTVKRNGYIVYYKDLPIKLALYSDYSSGKLESSLVKFIELDGNTYFQNMNNSLYTTFIVGGELFSAGNNDTEVSVKCKAYVEDDCVNIDGIKYGVNINKSSVTFTDFAGKPFKKPNTWDISKVNAKYEYVKKFSVSNGETNILPAYSIKRYGFRPYINYKGGRMYFEYLYNDAGVKTGFGLRINGADYPIMSFVDEKGNYSYSGDDYFPYNNPYDKNYYISNDSNKDYIVVDGMTYDIYFDADEVDDGDIVCIETDENLPVMIGDKLVAVNTDIDYTVRMESDSSGNTYAYFNGYRHNKVRNLCDCVNINGTEYQLTYDGAVETPIVGQTARCTLDDGEVLTFKVAEVDDAEHRVKSLWKTKVESDGSVTNAYTMSYVDGSLEKTEYTNSKKYTVNSYDGIKVGDRYFKVERSVSDVGSGNVAYEYVRLNWSQQFNLVVVDTVGSNRILCRLYIDRRNFTAIEANSIIDSSLYVLTQNGGFSILKRPNTFGKKLLVYNEWLSEALGYDRSVSIYELSDIENRIHFLIAKDSMTFPVSLSKPIDISLNKTNLITNFHYDEVADEVINKIVDMEKDMYSPVFKDVESGELSDVEKIEFNLHFRTRDLETWKMIQDEGTYATSGDTGDVFVDNSIDNMFSNWFVTDYYPYNAYLDSNSSAYKTEGGKNTPDAFINNNMNSSDLLGFLYFTTNDVQVKRKKLEKSFLRLTYFDSRNPLKQNMLGTSTLYFDCDRYFDVLSNTHEGIFYEDVAQSLDIDRVTEGIMGSNGVVTPASTGDKIAVNRNTVPGVLKEAFVANSGDYTTVSSLAVNNMENAPRLDSRIIIGDIFTDSLSSEGFYSYILKAFANKKVEQTIYMKAEFFHAGVGIKIPMMLAVDDDDNAISEWTLDKLDAFKDGYGLKDIYNKMYTPITISYSKELRKFVYRVSDERNYSVATKNGNKLRFNLFELKIKAQ